MQYRYVAPHPFGELPRWGAKNVLPLNLMALPERGMTHMTKYDFFTIVFLRVCVL